jgi:hypothetical protein
MQFLLDLAREDRDIRRISELATGFPSVQGIVLDVDRFWLDSWTIAQFLGENFLRRRGEWIWRRFRREIPFHSFLDDAYSRWLPRDIVYPRALTLKDLKSWKPPFWREYADFSNVPDKPRSLPIVVKVCVRPSWEEDKEKTIRVETLQERTSRFRVIIEGRSQGVLAANPRRKTSPLVGGVSIGKVGSTEFGTLGVILDDGVSKRYAITCSHVVDQQNVKVIQPSEADSKKASIFGKRIAGTTLTSCPVTSECNPWSGVNTNEEDIALIEIDKSTTQTALEVLNIGSLNGIVSRASISNGQSVQVMGRTTKHSYLSVGGVAAWYRMSHQGNFYCFKHLFEVMSPYNCSSTIKEGDSGAPVCAAHGTGMGWCGMIVGCDSSRGFAMYSETIENWWKSKNYNLLLR